MSSRLSKAIAAGLLVLLAVCNVLMLAGAPARATASLGIAFFVLAVLWLVARIGSAIAAWSTRPPEIDGPEADYHDPPERAD